MAKTEKEKERESFKQVALEMSRYRLRNAVSRTGISGPDLLSTESEKGPSGMVDLLMTKFDEGKIDLVGLQEAAGQIGSGGNGTSAAAKPAPAATTKKSTKSSTKKSTTKKASPKETEKDKGNGMTNGDPYTTAFSNDVEETPADPYSAAFADGNAESEPPKEEKTKKGVAKKRGGAKSKAKAAAPTDDAPAPAAIAELKDMIEDVMEAQGKLSEASEEKFNKVLTATDNLAVQIEELRERNLIFQEQVKFALAQIWAQGTAKPIKQPEFLKVLQTGEEFYEKTYVHPDDND